VVHNIQKGHRLSDTGHHNPVTVVTGVDNVGLNIYSADNDDIPHKKDGGEEAENELLEMDFPSEEPVILKILNIFFNLRLV
jgi:hypothetical protein